MSTVQMRYHGWVALPEAALRKFGLTTGAKLEVELAGDAIVLRPSRGSAVAELVVAEPAPAAPEEKPAKAADASPVAGRRPGRPRKTPAEALPQRLRTGGRRKVTPQPEA